jgi:Protein of unknown function (DUF3995)
MLREGAALIASAVLLAIAALHVYWAFGGHWPGVDGESLARTVVGGPPGMRMQPPWSCLAVAVLLTVASGLLFANRGLLELGLPRELARVGAFGVATVLLGRGSYGFFDLRMRPSIQGSRYARLNLAIYSPLCLALGTLALISALK